MLKQLPWWQRGPIYQIYPMSFADSNNDGIGDIEGIIRKLDYLNNGTEQSLGIEAIWLSPIYPSPLADFGYDVSDYCAIHPLFGNLENFKRLMEECGKRNIKIIMDLVANHTSHQHEWFKESSSGKDNPKRDWYIWRDAKPDGSPPNNWPSLFGGTAWEWHEPSGQYYLHKFLKEQPDLNLWNPLVQKAILDAMKFWLELGVNGFRMDVADLLLEDPTFADAPVNPNYVEGRDHPGNAVFWTKVYWREETMAIINSWRKLLDKYKSVGIGEVNRRNAVSFYGNADDGLQLPFNFLLLETPWEAPALKRAIDEYQNALGQNSWPNYVLGNHDNSRVANRIGHENLRAAAMLLLTLPGTPFIYYGEEIGMENVDIPKNQHKDTPSLRSTHEDSRDPERAPMQWNPEKFAGFSEVDPWLPLGKKYDHVNVETQNQNKTSLLWLYKKLIQLRKNSSVLQCGEYESIYVLPETVLAYRRYDGEDDYLILLNCSDKAVTPDLSEYCFGGRCIFSTHPIASFTIDKDITIVRLRPHEGKIFKIY